MQNLSWVEISESALKHNIALVRKVVGPDVVIAPCVKGNAYGHGLVRCGKAFLDGGADWLCVNALFEARELRDAGVEAPIYILGYVPLDDLAEAIDLKCRLIVYNRETIERLGEIGKPVKVHLKVETGNNRQGILGDEIADFARFIGQFQNIEIEGISTHFANIEDTTDHSYARRQLTLFKGSIKALEAAGFQIPLKHCANSAACLVMKETHFNMVRPGIIGYGLWPSNETFLSFLRENDDEFELKPALIWKTKIAQVKEVAAGEYVGYGCTYKMGANGRLAILPVGYYDGYDRGVQGGYVLIHGKRAPIRGRICMNIMMVDVTDIPEAKLEDDVVLIGTDGEEKITAEDFASWAGTINYEAVTRIRECRQG